LFMTPIRQWKRVDRVMVECTCLLHIAALLTLEFYDFNLFSTCRTNSFCSVALWQLARFQLTRRSELSCGFICVILCLAFLVEHRLVTDRQTDTNTGRHRRTQGHSNQ